MCRSAIWGLAIDARMRASDVNSLRTIRKDIAVFRYEIRRSSIDKNDLPVVRIYMSDGAVAKLNEKRNAVLAKERPIHISDRKDWVRARVIVEFDGRKEKIQRFFTTERRLGAII